MLGRAFQCLVAGKQTSGLVSAPLLHKACMRTPVVWTTSPASQFLGREHADTAHTFAALQWSKLSAALAAVSLTKGKGPAGEAAVPCQASQSCCALPSLIELWCPARSHMTHRSALLVLFFEAGARTDFTTGHWCSRLKRVVPRVCVVGGKAAPDQVSQLGAGDFT